MLRRAQAAIAGVAAGAVLAAGCGGDDTDAAPPPPPASEGRLLDALESIGGGEAFTGTGYGWIDVQALRAGGDWDRDLDWAGRALGPGGDRLVVEAGSTAGLDVRLADARRLVSLSGSYVFGLRADGVDTEAAEDALRAAGAKPTQGSPWTRLDLGPPASRPLGSDLEQVGALASRTAVSDDSLVLARMDDARTDLEGEGTPASEAPAGRASATCLGDVDAARIVPNNFTHLPNVGPDVMAFGVEQSDHGERAEVLCAIDETAEEIDKAEAGMRAAFEPGAVDEVTGERISSLVDDVEIERLELDGLPVVRARLDPSPTNGPGFLFGAFVRGSLVTYLGLQPPLADAE
jgi:hypothetical protein